MDAACHDGAPCRGRCMRVSHEGAVYRCVKALSVAIGCKPNAIYQAVYRHGTADMAGKGTGFRSRSYPPPAFGRKVTVGPHSWPSIAALARDMGYSRTHMRRLILNDPQAVLAMVMRRSVRNE